MKLWMIYIIGINVISFLVYGLDKWKARNEKYRISERTLLLLAAVGGSIGAYAGMQIFRHKTQKAKFYLGVPAIILLQIGVFLYIRINL